MNFLIDMNLTPRWLQVFQAEGWQSRHWSDVGNPRAPDDEVMEWARQNNFIVFTHDLDFGRLLALSQAGRPSVVQLRTHQVLPELVGPLVVDAIRQFQDDLQNGALMSIDQANLRIRILPFN